MELLFNNNYIMHLTPPFADTSKGVNHSFIGGTVPPYEVKFLVFSLFLYGHFIPI